MAVRLRFRKPLLYPPSYGRTAAQGTAAMLLARQVLGAGRELVKRGPILQFRYLTHIWSSKMPYCRLYWKLPTRSETKSACLLL